MTPTATETILLAAGLLVLAAISWRHRQTRWTLTRTGPIRTLLFRPGRMSPSPSLRLPHLLWRYLAAALPLLALGLAGCGAVPGSSTYSCGLPEGVTCTSARNVYKLTNSGLPVTAMPGQPTALDPAAGGNPAPAATGPTAGPAVATGSLASTLSPLPPLPTPGQVQTIALRPEDAGAADIVPLRTPSRVLRVWIAPWEDTAGRLHVPGYTYAEIEPRRWSIGEGAATGGLQLKPLTQPAPPTPPETPPALQAREPELQDAAARPPRRRQPSPPPTPRRQPDSATQPVGSDQTYPAPP